MIGTEMRKICSVLACNAAKETACWVSVRAVLVRVCVRATGLVWRWVCGCEGVLSANACAARIMRARDRARSTSRPRDGFDHTRTSTRKTHFDSEKRVLMCLVWYAMYVPATSIVAWYTSNTATKTRAPTVANKVSSIAAAAAMRAKMWEEGVMVSLFVLAAVRKATRMRHSLRKRSGSCQL
eukprot:2580026-Pleurochrysis_carterae.AAC.4